MTEPTPVASAVAHKHAVDAALRLAVETTVDHDHPETTPRLPVMLARWRAATWVCDLIERTE